MIEIVFFQRGNVVIGFYSRKGSEVEVTNAAVVRRWGTEHGIGELALKGPRKHQNTATILDFCGTVRAPELGVVMRIECDQEIWEPILQANYANYEVHVNMER